MPKPSSVSLLLPSACQAMVAVLCGKKKSKSFASSLRQSEHNTSSSDTSPELSLFYSSIYTSNISLTMNTN